MLKRIIIITGAFFSFLFLNSCAENKEKINEEEAIITSTNDTILVKYNEQIKTDPNNPDLYHERAKYFFATQNVEAALADMNRVFILDSSKAEYFITLSALYFSKGMAGNVKASLEKSIELEPKNITALMKLAELYLYLEKHKECIGTIDKVLRIDKYNAKAYFIKGMAFKETGDTAKAVSSFQTTVEQDPEYYHAYMQLGLLFSSANNKLAIDYFNSAIKINPQSTEAYYGLGLFLQENEMYEKAIEAYTIILQIDPIYKHAYYNLGYVHSEYLKDYKAAIGYFSNAIKSSPEYYEAFYMRGLSYERIGDLKNAEADYRASLKIKPDYDLAAMGLNRIV